MGVVRQLRQIDADAAGVDIAFRADVHAGLAQQQKAFPARWFYDATGSALFEDITALPEYYPTRSETDLLARHAAAMASAIGAGRALIELGSGSSTKTPLLLDAIAPAAYVPVDISGDFLRDSALALARRFPGLPIYPVEADFTQRVELPREIVDQPKLGFFPGSTIGNMVARTAIDLLRNWRCALGEGSLLLIGIDRIKDVATLELAYDDPAGVTAAFNLNLLERINRELGGDIAVENFAHRAVWDEVHARIEMHLVAACDMDFTVDGRAYHMAAGETIHSENSHKYGPRDANLLLRASGWTPIATWDDADPAFALILAEATPFRSAP
ncbi:L-histidine N(alpha)-methyltransferase [Sphingopyxis sp. RIFCSPHIGHO2_12_FULL_65_19]|uniref:L-histidine N(alpha)-methyltransferase n=1 Tax=Sphingopyxis sp. RIFCSPHIGHO2_12_FULL_65_19 TaxID=1802172 RepID=UPI0008C92816|nr:L-histidine N(alpha)-methyltransferase [Sphingopyxis sp. RIFCSPHIGHO2_12_FULL_65_19]OHD08260.1 MAG: dimethylhistidine N-methyltransferase [Sphingopyxis sp. RIFCSPHIGHO2_12_FULL_65_19]